MVAILPSKKIADFFFLLSLEMAFQCMETFGSKLMQWKKKLNTEQLANPTAQEDQCRSLQIEVNEIVS